MAVGIVVAHLRLLEQRRRDRDWNHSGNDSDVRVIALDFDENEEGNARGRRGIKQRPEGRLVLNLVEGDRFRRHLAMAIPGRQAIRRLAALGSADELYNVQQTTMSRRKRDVPTPSVLKKTM